MVKIGGLSKRIALGEDIEIGICGSIDAIRLKLYYGTGVASLRADAGANVETVGEFGETLLDHVSYSGDTEIIKLLLEYGTNVNAINNHGAIALSWRTPGLRPVDVRFAE